VGERGALLGIFGVPERQLGLLPDDLVGSTRSELGCGTAYRLGLARPARSPVVGIDNSRAQLATAHRLQREHGLDFPLLHGKRRAVTLPGRQLRLRHLGVRCLSLADPHRWIPKPPAYCGPAADSSS